MPLCRHESHPPIDGDIGPGHREQLAIKHDLTSVTVATEYECRDLLAARSGDTRDTNHLASMDGDVNALDGSTAEILEFQDDPAVRTDVPLLVVLVELASDDVLDQLREMYADLEDRLEGIKA